MNVVTKAADLYNTVGKITRNFTPAITYVGTVKDINKSVNLMKGVGSMDDSIRKMSVVPTLPNNVKAAMQQGNSTHKSLFRVAFLFCLEFKSFNLAMILGNHYQIFYPSRLSILSSIKTDIFVKQFHAS